MLSAYLFDIHILSRSKITIFNPGIFCTIFLYYFVFLYSILLELISYDRLRLRLSHLFIGLLYYVELQQIGGRVRFSALHTELIQRKERTSVVMVFLCRSSTKKLPLTARCLLPRDTRIITKD